MSPHSHSKILSPPPHIAIKGPCDLWCAFCNARGVRHLATEGELERVSRELERLARLGHRMVGFGLQHSEPTTHPALHELLARARQLGFERIMLSTSGLSLVDPQFTKSLSNAGLTDVNVTFVGPAGKVTDILLGRSGAGAAKLQALENASREGLGVFVPLALLRPALLSLPDLFREVKAIFGGGGPRFHCNALLLDPVEGMEPERIALLWPRFGEILWIMRRLRALAPDIELQTHHLPPCACSAISGVSIPNRPLGSAVPPERFELLSGMCDVCPDRSRCDGMLAPFAHIHRALPTDEVFEERPPSEPDTRTLRSALDALRAGSESTAELAQLKLYVAPLLSRLSRERRVLFGFAVDEVTVDIDAVSATLRSGQDVLSIVIEPITTAKDSFLTGDRVALSYRSETPVDTESKRTLIQALLELIERALDVGR